MSLATSGDLPELLPARMLNEFVYCPRLFHLEWVGSEWRSSHDTIEGASAHRRVDQPKGSLSQAGDGSELTSLHLSSEELGLTAVLDKAVKAVDGSWMPVDTKKGKLPPTGFPWPADRMQIAVQALLLRAEGYECNQAAVFYAGSKRRTSVLVDDELVVEVKNAVLAARECAADPQLPPPLVDSPKCARCSLQAICLPEETRALQAEAPGDAPKIAIVPPTAQDAYPLYVQAHGAKVTKDRERLVVKERDGQSTEARLIDVSQLCVMGNITITASAIRALMERSVPIVHMSYGGWFQGVTHPIQNRNAHLRIEQVRAATDPQRALALSTGMVSRKIQNQRTVLRRNGQHTPPSVMAAMKSLAEAALGADSQESLLGIEGLGARHYFQNFAGMLRSTPGKETFDFEGRNRRPPKDPVNALLSLAYATLTKDWTVTLFAVGLDPFIGVLHRPRFGRPSLALDLMEEFRPIIADSVVLQLINNGEVDAGSFVQRGGKCALTPGGRKKFYAAYERRMSHEITHPIFGYKISYRQLLEIQARLFGRACTGELESYDGFTVR